MDCGQRPREHKVLDRTNPHVLFRFLEIACPKGERFHGTKRIKTKQWGQFAQAIFVAFTSVNCAFIEVIFDV